MNNILEVINLNVLGYNNFCLNIPYGKNISIIGSNMCGKTTLFKIIAGIIPTNNNVKCNNIWLNKKNVNKYIMQIGVSIPYQEGIFLFDNVIDEMQYPLTNLGYKKKYIDSKIDKILEKFNLDIKNKKIDELSYLEKTKLLICISLLHEPKVLLLDGVIDNLLPSDALSIINTLKTFNVTIIYFSSNLNYINESDYIYILSNKSIYLEGNSKTILKHSHDLKKVNLVLPKSLEISNKLKNKDLSRDSYQNIMNVVREIWK